MNTVVLNEDEARSLLIFINYRIENEIMEEMSANEADSGLDYLGGLFSVRRKCMEVVKDG